MAIFYGQDYQRTPCADPGKLNLAIFRLSLSVTGSAGDKIYVGRLPRGAIPLIAYFEPGVDALVAQPGFGVINWASEVGTSASVALFSFSGVAPGWSYSAVAPINNQWNQVTRVNNLGPRQRIAPDPTGERPYEPVIWNNQDFVFGSTNAVIGHCCDLHIYYAVD